MVLTRQDKEKLVTDLYNQGMTMREIAKKSHMSFRDIGTILKRAAGEMEDKEQSPSSQAYQLFSEGKALIDVAIFLDLSENEVTKYYEEYLNLKQMFELRMVHKVLGPYIAHFLKLFRILKKERISPQQIVNLLRIAENDLPALERRYYRLNKDIVLLQQKSEQMGSQARILSKMSEDLQATIEELNIKKIALQSLIRKFEDDKEYKKIRKIAEEEVNNTLTKSKELITLAVASVLESITNDPNKYIFLVNSNHYNDNKWLTKHYRSLILDDSQKLFEGMARELTNKILDSVILKTGL